MNVPVAQDRRCSRRRHPYESENFRSVRNRKDPPLICGFRDFVRKHKLESRIILTGRVPHADVPGILSAMDFAVLPAAADYSSPVKLFEFMAAGIPAVAPDYNPVKEILTDGENGWLFPAGNISAAVERVFTLSQDPVSLKRVGAKAREYIARERQWSNNIDQLMGLFESMDHRAKSDVAR